MTSYSARNTEARNNFHCITRTVQWRDKTEEWARRDLQSFPSNRAFHCLAVVQCRRLGLDIKSGEATEENVEGRRGMMLRGGKETDGGKGKGREGEDARILKKEESTA